MRLVVLVILLESILAICGTARQIVPVEPRDELPLVPGGGKWLGFDEVNLNYNPKTNRILSVVYQSSQPEGYRVIRFDASTNALSGGERTARATDVVHLDSHISPDGKSLFIAWGDREAAMAMGTEREVAIGVEQFNLETFDASQSSQHEWKIYHFDVDNTGNRIVGIADPVEGATDYSLLTVDLEATLSTARTTGMERDRAIAKDALFDASRDRLLVLYMPTKPGNTSEVEFEGQVVAYNLGSPDGKDKAEVARSATFEGEFTPHSLALSRNGQSLVVAARSSNVGKIPLLDAETLAVSYIQEATLGGGFKTNGSAFFDEDDLLWIPGQRNNLEASIVVYDVSSRGISRHVSGATDTDVFAFAPRVGRVFGGSDSLHALHVLSVTDTQARSHIDLQFEPIDMSVDPETGVFHVLGNNGKINLFSEDGPTFLGRRLDYAYQPSTEHDVRPKRRRMLQDPVNKRLYVTRQLSSPPALLNARLGYQTTGSLSVIADTLAMDNSWNRLYTAGAMSPEQDAKVIREMDGGNLSDSRTIATLPSVEILPGLFRPAPSPIEMEVDEGAEALWVLSPSLVDGADPPILRNLSLRSSSTPLELSLPFGDVGDLVLDPSRNRVLLTHQSGSALSLYEIYSSTENLVLGATYSLEAPEVYDSVGDASYELAYFLTRVAEGTPEWRLAAWDLRTSDLHDVYRLGFLSGNSARMAFNSRTNTFAVVAAQGDRAYFFDNPVEEGRRTRPVPSSGFSSFATGQTVSGIEVVWSLTQEGDEGIRGVFVERRQQSTGEWIRLTPLPVPPDMESWTDTTAEPGIEYQYRLWAGGASSSVVLGPVKTEPPEGGWLASIPEVVVPIEPNGIEEVMVSVSGFRLGGTRKIKLKATLVPASVQVTIFPEAVPQPGTARLRLTCKDGTEPGVYGLIVEASDGANSQEVPLLVRVCENEGEALRRILRKPTAVALSSDSDLDQSRLSIRGQLGVRRQFVRPLPVKVQAFLPDGSTKEVVVVAATGEFTADFSIPEDAAGEWVLVATFPGSLDLVGGRSSRFSFPAQDKNRKIGENLEDQGLGQIVITKGLGGESDSSGDLDALSDLVKETFLSQRYEEGKDLVQSATSYDSFTKAVTDAASETDNLLLLYMLGDAEFSGDPPTFRFPLPSGESIEYGTLESLLAGMIGEVTPILVLDCPHAGEVRKGFENSLHKGAYLFSVSDESSWTEWVGFGDEWNFTNKLLEGIARHGGIGHAFDWASGTYGLSGVGLIEDRFPTSFPDIADASSAFFELNLGSSLTPSHSLIRDSIPPEIRIVNSSERTVVGTSFLLYAEVEDLPFDRVLSVNAMVNHPDGVVQTLELSAEAGSDLYTNSFQTRIPGSHNIDFVAFDGFKRSFEHTTILVEGRVDPQVLLELLRGCRSVHSLQLTSANTRESILFGAAQSWYSMEGVK